MDARLEEARPSDDALAQMRARGGDWFAYLDGLIEAPRRNGLIADGRVTRYLKCGPGCTFETPPATHPDLDGQILWRYCLIGQVNLTTGVVEPVRGASQERANACM